MAGSKQGLDKVPIGLILGQLKLCTGHLGPAGKCCGLSMPPQMGIVGMPNVGKSTLFNLLTKCAVPAENFPFCKCNLHTHSLAGAPILMYSVRGSLTRPKAAQGVSLLRMPPCPHSIQAHVRACTRLLASSTCTCTCRNL